MSEVSRSREANFSIFELEFLLECIRRHIDTIENKRSDSNSSHAKAKAWAAISQEFEANPECKARAAAQLDAKWKGLKQVRAFLLPDLYIHYIHTHMYIHY